MIRRRHVLQLGAVGLVGMAGCLDGEVPAHGDDGEEQDDGAADHADDDSGDDSGDDDASANDGDDGDDGDDGEEGDVHEPTGYVRPDGDPETVPEAHECPDAEYEPHWKGYSEGSVQWGDVGDVALRVNDRSFEYGETVEVTLINTSSGEADTGNRNKYNLEVYTEDGWHEIRGWDDGEPRPYTDEALRHDPGRVFTWTFDLTEDGIAEESIHADHLRVCPDLPSGRYRFTFWSVLGGDSVAVAFDLQRDG